MTPEAARSLPAPRLRESTECSALAKLGRKLVLAQLARLARGEVRIIEANGVEHRFGRRTTDCQLAATIHVENPQLYAEVAFGGTLGSGQAYINGYWRCDDLVALVRIFIINRDVMKAVDGAWSFLSKPLLQVFHFLNRNSRRGSARNISAHYDLGNALYELMLDKTMAYSCGIFATPESSLHEASVAKFDAACRKLALAPTDRVLEIGCGWGGFAIHAASHYGCHVTATTLSRQQYDFARARIDASGLQNRITLLLEDYRDLTGCYDKIVSIEMVEAVGAAYLDTYTSACSRLLKDDGAMFLQAITLRDQLYASALRSVDYIQRYIFPGSFIPSVTALADSFGRTTDLKIFHLEDIGPHYARTLRLWRERFFANVGSVRRLGYPEHFVRMWEYYLCYCEGGFEERQLGDVQMLLTKPGSRLAPVPFP